ncbi:dipeptide epimerase [Wenzhouxiangella limi]|uniref:Dipeptide epimerase n=1 Tax=Wenzhouxiangella limi TaxID=2707351 RepID=A0A845VAA0_9GAMM|nr:dipeptide epimerase [Wenzhouxiangella limi]NDY96835.1 dipeptide epimerase [Wenzhouxiangella limi]
MALQSITLQLDVRSWPLKIPFRITGHVFDSLDLLVCTLSCDGVTGQGEAAGVYYHDETAESLRAQIEAVRPAIEAGIDRADLQDLLPAGGARNALDCALWALESRRGRRAAWQLAGLAPPQPLLTTFTLGADLPAVMAERAAGLPKARALKLKLIGDGHDAERVAAVRHARPHVWLGVDANQAFDRAATEALLPALVEARVDLLEQPCRIGEEESLRGLDCPIPLAADESVQTRRELESLVDLFDAVNIKLDKCGGLTEALAMAHRARALGLRVMVGNMIGTSLSCAPAFVVGQLCDIVDLDGPWHLAGDVAPAVDYLDGYLHCPAGLWDHAGAGP